MQYKLTNQAVINSGYNVFDYLLNNSPIQNSIFISPLSIDYALLLTLNGAGFASSTHREILSLISVTQGNTTEDALNNEFKNLLNDLTDNGNDADVLISNSFWTKNDEFLPSYTELVAKYFKASAHRATSYIEINKWISESTKGKISDVLDSDDFEAVLVNTLYFKGFWKSPFKKHMTTKSKFFVPMSPIPNSELKTSSSSHMDPVLNSVVSSSATKTVDVDMMCLGVEHRSGVLRLDVPDVVQAIRLPYKDERFVAVAALPAAGITPFAALQSVMSNSQEFHPANQVTVRLPKFKIKSSFDLSLAFQELGVHEAFSTDANFSRMTNAKGLKISNVLHETVVEVDEEGTEAAAATAIMMNRAMFIPNEEIVFNRPFLFIILHAPSNTPIFIGYVVNPMKD